MRRGDLWSDGAMALLRRLEYHGVGGATRRYPSGGPLGCSRREFPLFKLHTWLAERGDEGIDAQLTDTILVLAEVEWADAGHIRAFCLQAFVTEGITLDGLRCRSEADCAQALSSAITGRLRTITCPHVMHYRCESHEHALGKPFREPPTHLHRELKGAPRMPLPVGQDGNPIVAFLEFLALNHDYGAWLRWAEQVCRWAGLEADWRAVEAVYRCAAGGRTLDAVLAEHGAALTRVRAALHAARDGAFPWRMAGNDRLLLGYWS